MRVGLIGVMDVEVEEIWSTAGDITTTIITTKTKIDPLSTTGSTLEI